MFTRLFDHDPITGTKTFFHHDQSSDIITMETQSDVSELIEINKIARNARDERANWKGDLHHVASIPMEVYFDLKAKGIINKNEDPEFKRLRAWLNDADNRAFRSRPGRV